MYKNIETEDMVFCYQNCSDLLCEKIVLVIEKKFCKIFVITRTIYSNSERPGESFSWWLEQFFLTVGQNNFGNKIPFLSFSEWQRQWFYCRTVGRGHGLQLCCRKHSNKYRPFPGKQNFRPIQDLAFDIFHLTRNTCGW